MENIEYQIKYSKIKNIYIQIKNGQVIIKAPKRVSKKQIEKYLFPSLTNRIIFVIMHNVRRGCREKLLFKRSHFHADCGRMV